MSTATKPKERRFVVASNPTLADEILGHTVALRPLRREQVETTRGPAEAVFSRVVDLDDLQAPVDLGEGPIFWTVVKRQLSKATDASPWVIGRLVLSGTAYLLEPVEVDPARVEKVLAQFED